MRPPAPAAGPLLLAWSLCALLQPPASGQQAPAGSAANERRYAVVVDCGSSGSRAHLFSWSAAEARASRALVDVIRPMRDPETRRVLAHRIRPGLASTRDQPDRASDYMRPIMDFVQAHIPAEARPQTLIYFMATAGLRLLSDRLQKQILDDLIGDLSREYDFPKLHGEVISGQREALYQWLSVNAHAHRLGPQFDELSQGYWLSVMRGARGRRHAVVELGGASAQVAFELTPRLERQLSIQLGKLPDASAAFQAAQLELRAPGLVLSSEDEQLGAPGGGGCGLGPPPRAPRRLFAATFLGFGTKSARELAIQLLAREALARGAQVDSQKRLILLDPCLTPGANDSRLLAEQGALLKRPPGSGPLKVQLHGLGHMGLCERLLVRVLALVKRDQIYCDSPGARREPCAARLLAAPFLPWHELQVVGLSELFYTTNEMIEAPGLFNAPLVRARAARICATPHQQLLAMYPHANRVDPNRVLNQCFKATWMLTWLHYGLLMPPKHSSRGSGLETLSSIEGNTLDWTLGALAERLAAANDSGCSSGSNSQTQVNSQQ